MIRIEKAWQHLVYMFTQTRPKKFVNKVGLKERTGPWWQVRYARADPQESREIKEHERRKSIFGYQSCLPENHSSLRKPCSFPIIKNGANTSCQLNHPTSATKITCKLNSSLQLQDQLSWEPHCISQHCLKYSLPTSSPSPQLLLPGLFPSTLPQTCFSLKATSQLPQWTPAKSGLLK